MVLSESGSVVDMVKSASTGILAWIICLVVFIHGWSFSESPVQGQGRYLMNNKLPVAETSAGRVDIHVEQWSVVKGHQIQC